MRTNVFPPKIKNKQISKKKNMTSAIYDIGDSCYLLLKKSIEREMTNVLMNILSIDDLPINFFSNDMTDEIVIGLMELHPQLLLDLADICKCKYLHLAREQSRASISWVGLSDQVAATCAKEVLTLFFRNSQRDLMSIQSKSTGTVTHGNHSIDRVASFVSDKMTESVGVCVLRRILSYLATHHNNNSNNNNNNSNSNSNSNSSSSSSITSSASHHSDSKTRRAIPTAAATSHMTSHEDARNLAKRIDQENIDAPVRRHRRIPLTRSQVRADSILVIDDNNHNSNETAAAAVTADKKRKMRLIHI